MCSVCSVVQCKTVFVLVVSFGSARKSNPFSARARRRGSGSASAAPQSLGTCLWPSHLLSLATSLARSLARSPSLSLALSRSRSLSLALARSLSLNVCLIHTHTKYASSPKVALFLFLPSHTPAFTLPTSPCLHLSAAMTYILSVSSRKWLCRLSRASIIKVICKMRASVRALERLCVCVCAREKESARACCLLADARMASLETCLRLGL